MASNIVPVMVAYGDGIGPEIMNAALHITKEAGARIGTETSEIGERVYLRGVNAGVEPLAWESLRRTKAFYRAPITMPQGGGFKSLNENGSGNLTHQQIVNLLDPVQKAGLDFIKIENLYTFDRQNGFVGSQGE